MHRAITGDLAGVCIPLSFVSRNWSHSVSRYLMISDNNWIVHDVGNQKVTKTIDE